MINYNFVNLRHINNASIEPPSNIVVQFGTIDQSVLCEQNLSAKLHRDRSN